jgi:acyl carrier protein
LHITIRKFLLITGPDFVDWVNLEVPDEKIETAKAVIATIAQVTGTSMEVVAENLENSFYNIGGSSLNSVVVIVKLREMKYHISIQDFISAKAIKHIIWHTHLVEDPEEEDEFFVTEEADKKYVVNMLTDADKEDTTQ